MIKNTKIVDKLKKAIKEHKQSNLSEALNEKLVHPMFRERDMRKEAMDMGSHGANDYFGEKENGA